MNTEKKKKIKNGRTIKYVSSKKIEKKKKANKYQLPSAAYVYNIVTTTRRVGRTRSADEISKLRVSGDP